VLSADNFSKKVYFGVVKDSDRQEMDTMAKRSGKVLVNIEIINEESDACDMYIELKDK